MNMEGCREEKNIQLESVSSLSWWPLAQGKDSQASGGGTWVK